MTFSIMVEHCYAECHLCCFIYTPFILSVVMLSVVMLSVVMLSAIMLSVIMLSVIMLSVVVPHRGFVTIKYLIIVLYIGPESQ